MVVPRIMHIDNINFSPGVLIADVTMILDRHEDASLFKYRLLCFPAPMYCLKYHIVIFLCAEHVQWLVCRSLVRILSLLTQFLVGGCLVSLFLV